VLLARLLQRQQHQVCAKHGPPAAPEAAQAAREGLVSKAPSSILQALGNTKRSTNR
jgi:hypothetical protein